MGAQPPAYNPDANVPVASPVHQAQAAPQYQNQMGGGYGAPQAQYAAPGGPNVVQVQETYCGPVSVIIGLCICFVVGPFGCFVACCPCDSKTVTYVNGHPHY
mmetsp:Transcript_14931/g.36527  ORF Transcript_14931/g.36527 Transcript_14931/m.36527 type:complete len:102 (+) Transcript_14931:136-441(+)